MADTSNEFDALTDEFADIADPPQSGQQAPPGRIEAAIRRAEIQNTPIPETPFKFQPPNALGLRASQGLGLTSAGTLLGTPGGPLGMAAGGMLGSAAAEGLDYLQSSPAERPSLGGAAARTALIGAIPAGGAALKALRPAAASVAEAAGGAMARTALGAKIMEAGTAALKTKTPEFLLKQAMMKDLEAASPLVDLSELFDEIKRIPGARAVIGDMERVLETYRGRVPLTEAENFLSDLGAKAWKGASTPAKEALKDLYTSTRSGMRSVIEEAHGPAVRKVYDQLLAEIGKRQEAVKTVTRALGKNPAQVVKKLTDNPIAARALQEIDNRLGTKLVTELVAAQQKLAEAVATRAAPATVGVAKRGLAAVAAGALAHLGWSGMQMLGMPGSAALAAGAGLVAGAAANPNAAAALTSAGLQAGKNMLIRSPQQPGQPAPASPADEFKQLLAGGTP